MNNDGTPFEAITDKNVDGLAKSAIKEANLSTASNAVLVDTLGMSDAQVSALQTQIANGVTSSKPIIYIK